MRLVRGFRRLNWVAWLLVFTLLSGSTTYATNEALTQQDMYDIGAYYYELNPDVCSNSEITSLSGTADAELHLTVSQINIAKTIIGIAKTDFPNGDEAKLPALIGIMAGLAEGGLKNYANDGKYAATSRDEALYGYPVGSTPYTALGPASTALPHDAVGKDHDSVGVFQQRAIDGNWAPIQLTSSRSNLGEVVRWLMKPEYAAQAFFGSPAGSNAPSALRKGLQNKSGWETMEPWKAAQAVQHSAFPDGSNYKAQYERAQNILTRYYGESPAIPLPVPFDGADLGTGSENTSICGGNTIVSQAIYLAQPTPKPGINKCKSDATEAYQRVMPVTQGLDPLSRDATGVFCDPSNREQNDMWSDCGVFVATTIRSSGADPDYTKRSTAKQLPDAKNNPKWQTVGDWGVDVLVLQPGDVMIRNYKDSAGENHGHTWIYLGKTAVEQAGYTYGHDMADASFHDHVPEMKTMGSPAKDHPFTVFRLIDSGV